MSDPNFPDEQHKTAFRRLPQAQVLDGGGEWKTIQLKASTSWQCPTGIYEVYVSLVDASSLLLKPANRAEEISLVQAVLTPVTGVWLPNSVGEVFNSFLADGVAMPNTQFNAAGSSILGITCARGWILSTGDELHDAGGVDIWFVRFRRVG